MVLTEDDGGLCLMLRVGDTFPNQTLEPVVRAYLYRWPGSVHNPGPDYTVRTRAVNPCMSRCAVSPPCRCPCYDAGKCGLHSAADELCEVNVLRS